MASLQEGGDTSSHKACSHCRSQKVRCIPDESDPDVCQRCARSGRTCVFTPLQKRKQRKRTDTRVAELEREMRAMRAMLHSKNKDAAAPSAAAKYTSTLGTARGNVTSTSTMPNAMASIQAPSTQLLPPSRPSNTASRGPADDGKDVIDRNIISLATARQLFETYRRDFFPHYPIVAIPSGVSVEDIRSSKPVLFLAIIAAASGKDHTDLSAMLDQEILEAYAARSLVQSEKSLEMVQALLISAIWYHPPSKFGQLKYYEYIHMATTMAMDLGIGTRPAPYRSHFGASSRSLPMNGGQARVHHLEDAKNPDLSLTPRSRGSSPQAGSIESRRTFVACYSICTALAMSLRRPNLLRVTAYLKECVEYLEQSPKALPSDGMLVAWVKLMMIAEEVNHSFQYDDPGGIALITELRTQLMLKDYAKRLDDFWANVPETHANGSLAMMYWNTRIYLHEVALHVDHSPDDFKSPYQMGIIHAWDGDVIPTQVLAEAIAECIASAHNLLTIFLAMDAEKCRGLPVLIWVRVSLAAFVLAKLCLSASHPGSQIGRVLDSNVLRAEEVLDKAILHVRAVIGTSTCRVPTIFMALLFKLRQWCLNPQMIEPPKESILQTGMGSVVKRDGVIEEEPSFGIVEQGGGTTDSSRLFRDSAAHDSVDNIIVGSERAAAHSDLAAQSSPTIAVQASTAESSALTEKPMPEVGDAASLTPPAPVSGYFNPSDQMQLDSDFFDFFGDVNALGSEDMWSTLPTDMLGLADGYDWQYIPTADEMGL